MSEVVSVIIATRNRAKILGDSIGSVLKQECPSGYRFELIIVDNNSSDNTRAVVEGMATLPEWTIKYLFQPEAGKSRCLNLAILKSSGDLLVFTDDDTVAAPGWLAALIECFQVHSCDAAGGRVLPLYPPGIPNWVKENVKILDGPIVFYDHGPENIQLDATTMSKFIGANLAVRREMFDKFGQFNVDLGPGVRTM